MIFNVFRRDMNMGQSLATKRGFKPYKKRAGLFGSKSYLVDELSGKANTYAEQVGLFSSERSGEASKFLDEERATWQDAFMRDIREDYAARAMEQSAELRGEAASALTGPTRRPSSTSEANAAFNRRVEGFRRARQKLRASKAAAKTAGVSDIKVDKTGYKMLNPSIDKFYQEYDRQLNERRNAYAQEYGGSNFNDLEFEGYAGMGLNPILSGADIGKADVDALVMGDMLDMSLYDLAFLDTTPDFEEGGEEFSFSVEETMGNIRESLGRLYQDSVTGLNQAATEEDRNREATALSIRNKTMVGKAKGQREIETSIDTQISDLNRAQRTAEQTKNKQMAALTDTGTSKKRVKGVDFKEERPM